MGPSGEMARTRTISARVDAEEHRRLKSMISDAGGSIDGFLQDAVREKLDRGGIATTEIGPLRGLQPEDRRLVEDLADVLRRHPDDLRLREVIRAQRGVLRLFLP